MEISHFAMPLTPERPGATSLDLRFDMLLTNLEKVPLIFRVRFEVRAFGPTTAAAKSALESHILVVKDITYHHVVWIGAGDRVAHQTDTPLGARQMIDVALEGSGLIPDTPSVGLLRGFGLQGTVAITLPVMKGAAQLDHPARVLASTFLRPVTYSAPRIFFPLVGGSPEFAIPPDVARLVFVPRAASRRKARRRARSPR